MTTATLGLAVESSQVKSASPELDRLTAAAGRAEAAANSLTSATSREAAAQQVATGAARMHAAALQAEAQAARLAASQRTNLVFQLNDIGVSLASGMNPLMVLAQQGSQISTIYGPGGLGKALQETGNIAVGIATKFWPIAVAVGAVAAGVAGLTAAINETSDVTVTFGDTALATWQVISGGIYSTLQPAIDAISPWFEAAWDEIKRGTADTINSLVRGWMGFMAEMELVAGTIEHIFDLTWQDVYNGFIDTVMQPLLESVWVDINKLLERFGQKPVKVDLSMMKVDAPGNNWSGPLLDKFNARKEQINSTDYAGQFFGEVSDKAQENARARELEEIGEAATKASEGLSRFDELTRGLEPLLKGASDPFMELKANLQDLDEWYRLKGPEGAAIYADAVGRAHLHAAAGVASAVSQITGTLAGAFEDNKALAAANIVVSTAAGAMKAFEQGGLLGFAGAAAIVTAGAVQLQSVLSAKPGSASTAGTGGGSAPAPSAAGASTGGPTASAQKVVNVTIQGDYFSPESGARFLKSIQDALGVDGLQINTSHKQA